MAFTPLRLSGHQPQCSCGSRNIFFRRLYNVFARNRSCSKAQEWLVRGRIPADHHRVYHDLLRSEVSDSSFLASWNLIQLDSLRTFPEEPYFEENSPGCQALKNVLSTFVKYDPMLGYVQGMNFITASLIWHSTEEDAFWLLVMLMEDYELRSNFLPNLPGLAIHCKVIDLLTHDHMTRLYYLLESYHLQSEMYASEWLFSLFSNMVPPQEMSFILDRFFAHGWPFFYRLILVILSKLSPMIFDSCGDFIEVISILKPSQGRYFLSKEGLRFKWRDLVEEAERTEIDNSSVAYMQLNFKETSKFCSVNYAN